MPRQALKLYLLITATFTAICMMAFVVPDGAWAATTGCSAGGGGGLPWEGPLCTIEQSLTGPVAYAISLIGIVVAGGMLIFGGEINEFARRIVMIVFVAALLLGSSQLVTSLGITGAVVG